MDALQMLREDHRKVKDLFRRFEEAQDKATKQAAAETALVELNIHSVLEEEIFYPAVRRQGNGSGAIVKRAEEEHHVAEQLMDDLMGMEPGNQEFDAKFHVLMENVKNHIDEEEAEMLPQAAEVGLARMEQLGKRMADRRIQLMSEGSSRTRKRSTGTRSRSTSGTRTRAAGARSRASKGARTKASTGTRSLSTTPPAKTGSRTTGGTRSRSTTSRARTVAQAGTRKRTAKTRTNTGSRRSGSQSGR
jgi:hemerythrin-like domain-containing protein